MKKKHKTEPESSGGRFSKTVYLMVFLSGFAGLVYQVLWMKQLGFLFGNTSYAASATLAAFFTGLACGSFFWGRRCESMSHPLRTYALLELGIALTALLYFGVIALFYMVYPFVYQHVAHASIMLIVKFLLALLLIFPPSFCMGGTIPVIGQFIVRRSDQLGIKAARLYGINTLGAAAGAFLTGFYFVRAVGFRYTCVGAMIITGLVAAVAYRLSLVVSPASTGKFPERDLHKKGNTPATKATKYWISTICFISGFSVLALEVIWTRLFAQIHENTIYSFSLVLVIVLICLALGALAASMLARLSYSPISLLAGLMVLGGLAVAVSPFVLMRMTNGLTMLDTRPSFLQYMLRLFVTGFGFLGPPAFLLGIVFPFLMRIEESFILSPGRSLGRLAAINTVGAVIGSVLCGFVFLEQFGVWRTTQFIAGLYLLAGIMLPVAGIMHGVFIKSVGAIVFLMLLKGLNPAYLPATGWDPARPPARVLEIWEASDCTVSVVETVDGHITIKINSNYSLGSTGAFSSQDFQGRMPLLVFPETKSIFFLGMGTGVTAGAALDREFGNVERVVTCELAPAVVTAAKKYMAGGGNPALDLTRGLFSDERSEIVVDDGRHYLMASGNKFDLINADLFLPYRSGAASLYSQEHFEAAKRCLNPGGVFVQWLPMYQITEVEFGVVAKTMLSVFQQVTMWRNNFQPGGEVVALIGHQDADHIPSNNMDFSSEKKLAVAGKGYRDLPEIKLPLNKDTILLVYCGNITEVKELFVDYPINTDDKPVIEYITPFSIRGTTDNPMNMPPTLVGPKLANLVDRIQQLCPPSGDPMLKNRSAVNRCLPVAGAYLHHVWIDLAMGEETQARKSWENFVREWLGQ